MRSELEKKGTRRRASFYSSPPPPQRGAFFREFWRVLVADGYYTNHCYISKKILRFIKLEYLQMINETIELKIEMSIVMEVNQSLNCKIS